MNKSLPDKWIRKAIYEAIDGMVVDGYQIPCYDTKITQDGNGDRARFYVIMSTQDSNVIKDNKCEWTYEASILLDFNAIYASAGNQGSRVLADDMVDEARSLLVGLELDPASGLRIVRTSWSFPADVAFDTSIEIVYRKFIRLEFKIA